MATRRLLAAPAALSAACVLLLAGAAVASRSAMPPQLSSVVVTHRVVATPIPPTPAPTATPAPAAVVRQPSGSGGGRAVATARTYGSGAGPFPTDGTVALPSLGVRAPIVRVLVGSDGQMALPRNARDVAWLDTGPPPGFTGNIVLAGHKNWSGAVGAFDRLDKLQPGDKVVFQLHGQTWTFAIQWSRWYDPDKTTVEEIMGPTGETSVTLITCGGPFDRRVRHYTQRAIARGVLVSGP